MTPFNTKPTVTAPSDMSLVHRPITWSRSAVRGAVGFVFCLTLLSAPTGRSLAEATPAAHRLADAAWNFGSTEDAVSLWTKEQAVALHKKLCGKRAKVSKHLIGPFSILVGTPENSRFVNKGQSDPLE